MKTILFAGLISLAAFPALAEKNPQPKPSGIVIHVFGPQMLTISAAQDKSGTASTSQAPGASPESISLGQAMHEMFVTGDPAQDGKPHFPRGRAASDHP